MGKDTTVMKTDFATNEISFIFSLEFEKKYGISKIRTRYSRLPTKNFGPYASPQKVPKMALTSKLLAKNYKYRALCPRDPDLKC